MPKFLIVYDIGYGEMPDVVEAKDQEAASEMAYEAWRMAAEESANYWSEPFTEENARNYDLEDELDD